MINYEISGRSWPVLKVFVERLRITTNILVRVAGLRIETQTVKSRIRSRTAIH
jgi:hypothetical protein